MDIYLPIKNIAREGLDNESPKQALMKILRFIAKEEEHYRLRVEYYEFDKYLKPKNSEEVCIYESSSSNN